MRSEVFASLSHETHCLFVNPISTCHLVYSSLDRPGAEQAVQDRQESILQSLDVVLTAVER